MGEGMEYWYAICPDCRGWFRIQMHPEIPVPLPMVFCCFRPLWWNLVGQSSAAPVC